MIKNSKGVAHVLLIVGIVLLGIVVFVFFWMRTKGIPDQRVFTIISPTSTPLPTNTPTPVPISVEEWKTYTNDDYGFAVKFNPESEPKETVGLEAEHRFAFLLSVRFGQNPLKFPNGNIVKISSYRSLGDYRAELLDGITEKIASEKREKFNETSWTKINYEIFMASGFVPITTAITNKGRYSYAITAPSADIDQILSTFEFI